MQASEIESNLASKQKIQDSSRVKCIDGDTISVSDGEDDNGEAMQYSLSDERHLISLADQAVIITRNLASSASQHPDLAATTSIRNVGIVVSSIILACGFPWKVEIHSVSLT
jgi:hypothetical protein